MTLGGDGGSVMVAVRAFAGGDLAAVDRIRAASRDEMDEAARSGETFFLNRAVLLPVLKALQLDRASQHRARIWAYFWREGLFPQQVDGSSPHFDTEWEDDPSYALNDVMGTLFELGDDDVGWLDRALLEQYIRRVAESIGSE